jgi:ArsR family transcriptional regulator
MSSPARYVDETPAKAVRLTRARRTAILKALADPRRFELLERIAKAGCPLGCAEARAVLPISAATLSHHIKELETAGLIDVRREGKFHFLTLRPGVLEALAGGLASLARDGCLVRSNSRPRKISTNLLNPISGVRNQFDSYQNVESMAFRRWSGR